MEYLGKIWRGDIALWKVYWLWGSLGNAVLMLLGALIAYLIGANAASFSSFDIGLINNTFRGISIVYAILLVVGIWRSAANYSAQNPGKGWGTVAKIMVVLVTLGALARVAATMTASSTTKVAYPGDRVQRDAMLAGLNKDLPKQVDEITRLDNIDLDGSTFIYKYTITRDVSGAADVQERMEKLVIGNTCGNPEARKALDEGLNYRYHYRNLSGGDVALVSVAAASCR